MPCDSAMTALASSPLDFELADLLGERVAARLQGLGLGLHGLAAGLEGVEALGVEIDLAGPEAVDNGLQVFAQQGGI